MGIVGITWPFTKSTFPSRPFSRSIIASIDFRSGNAIAPVESKRLSERISNLSAMPFSASGSVGERTMRPPNNPIET
jgi:hypothetical protein